MANYSVTTYVTDKQNTASDAVDLLETRIETLDTSKTLRLVQVVSVGGEYVGLAIYDT